MKRIVLVMGVLSILSGCSIYKKFETPEVTLATVCGEEVLTQDTLEQVSLWRNIYTDTLLSKLIDEALVTNTDLQIARLNIEQAEASLRASKLAYLPSLALSPEGSINWNKSQSTSYTYNLPLTMQWEVDIFGKLRNSKEQARAVVLQSEEYTKMVQTQLVATLANNYYTLLMLDEQIKITTNSIENQRQNLEVIIAMKEAGMQTELAVNQAQADYYNVQSTAKELKKQQKAVENATALLLNRTPQYIERATMENATDVNVDYTAPIPLASLANRPDVRNAEYELRGSFYNINIARSAFYPSILINGSAGWTNNLGVISNPGSMLLSAIGTLTQPLFNRGTNRANLVIAQSKYEQQLLTFEKTILTAGSEVNDALYACQISESKRSLREKQVEASAQAYANSNELMRNSSTTYLEVLTAQNMHLQAQLLYVAEWLEGIQGKINLYKALGGGD